jgi:hypothetical protein
MIIDQPADTAIIQPARAHPREEEPESRGV